MMYASKSVKAKLAVLTVAAAVMASVAVLATAGAVTGHAGDEPTVAGALAADQALARAIRDNDAKSIERLLSDDWAVIATSGGLGEGKYIFPDGIKSGALTRKSYELRDSRVRLYGNVALVTSKVRTSGMLGGKPFDIMERQTDVLVWKNGSWKCVLTHETKIPAANDPSGRAAAQHPNPLAYIAPAAAGKWPQRARKKRLFGIGDASFRLRSSSGGAEAPLSPTDR
jgi:ketosteroid isomerase-like protein